MHQHKKIVHTASLVLVIVIWLVLASHALG